jgi:hypothetical protein
MAARPRLHWKLSCVFENGGRFAVYQETPSHYHSHFPFISQWWDRDRFSDSGNESDLLMSRGKLRSAVALPLRSDSYQTRRHPCNWCDSNGSGKSRKNHEVRIRFIRSCSGDKPLCWLREEAVRSKAEILSLQSRPKAVLRLRRKTILVNRLLTNEIWMGKYSVFDVTSEIWNPRYNESGRNMNDGEYRFEINGWLLQSVKLNVECFWIFKQ